MKNYEVTICTQVVGSEMTDTFEMPANATAEEVEAEAREIAFDMIDWSFKAIDE